MNTNSYDKDSIRIARRVLGLRQRDLADSIGVPPQRISDWETGLRAPTPEQSQRLLQVLYQHLAKTDGTSCL